MGKIVLFISAFVPMYIVFLVTLIIELINANLRLNITNTVVLVSLVLLILFGIFGLMFLINSRGKEYKKVTIVSKKNITDQHFLNYFSLFVLLALTFDLSKICFIFALVVILIFLGVVYIKNNIFYVNPLLNILGYSFYDISYIVGDETIDTRIFYKGELDISKCKYKLYTIYKNLYFLDKWQD